MEKMDTQEAGDKVIAAAHEVKQALDKVPLGLRGIVLAHAVVFWIGQTRPGSRRKALDLFRKAIEALLLEWAKSMDPPDPPEAA